MYRTGEELRGIPHAGASAKTDFHVVTRPPLEVPLQKTDFETEALKRFERTVMVYRPQVELV